MGNYNGDETYSPSIYIFEDTDLVLGGLNGTSNVPIKQLANNTSYLKKFTGSFLHGTIEPTASTLTGFNLDANSINNILYLNTVDGSIWKLTSISPVTWVNTYKTATLNVNGLSLNNNGDTADVLTFTYNAPEKTLELKDEFGNYGNIKVGRISFDTLESEQLNFSRVADSELILLYEITNNTENADAMFSVKRLQDIPQITVTGYTVGVTEDTWTVTLSSGVLSDYLTSNDFVQIKGFNENTGEIINGYYKLNFVSTNYFSTIRTHNAIIADNPTSQTGDTGTLSKDISAMIRWNNSQNYFEFVDRQNNLLPINCSGFFVNNIASGFVADRVISSNLQFNQLFSDNIATGSNICYLKKPETGYTDIIEKEYIYLKANTDTVDGHYELFNYVEILGSNIKIESAPGITIKYMNSTSGFRIQDDTQLNVYNYNNDEINILSENTQYINGDNIGNQHVMLANDKLFSFSDTGTANIEYTIDSISKNSDVSIFSTNTLHNHSDYDAKTVTLSGINYLYFAYIDAGVIYLKKYQYSNITKNYDNELHIWNSSDNGYSNVSIFLDTQFSNIYIVATQGANTQVKRVLFSAAGIPSTGTQQVNSQSYTNPKIYADGGYMYVLAYKSSSTTMKLFKTVYGESGMTIQSHDVSTTNILTTTTNQSYDFIIYNNEIIISFCVSSQLYLYKIDTNFGTGAEQIIATGTDQGYSSKLFLSGIITEPIYVVYTKDSTSTGTYEDMIYFGKVNLSTFAVTNQVEVFSSPSFVFTSFDIFCNDDNKYPTTSTCLFHIFAANNTITTGVPSWVSATSTNNGTTWATNELSFDSTGNSNRVRFANAENNIYTIVNCGTATKNCYAIKYNYYINISNPLEAGITDFILSTNFKKNIELKLEIDGDGYPSNEALCTGNSIDSDYTIKLINSYSYIGIDGNKKTHNNYYSLNIDNTNFMDTNINYINHSNIMKCFILKNPATGAKNFNECININYIGLLDNISLICNGKLDE